MLIMAFTLMPITFRVSDRHIRASIPFAANEWRRLYIDDRLAMANGIEG